MREKHQVTTRLARQYAQSGAPKTLDENEEQRLKIWSFEKYFDEVSPELYAVTAVVGDPIIRNPFNDRVNKPPFGLMTVDHIYSNVRAPFAPSVTAGFEHLDPELPFTSISDFTRHTLFQSLTHEIARMKDDDTKKPFLNRLSYLISQLNLRHPRPSNRYSAGIEGYLSGGINFGLLTMSAALDMIATLTPGKSTEERMEIVPNSFPLIQRLTSGKLEHRVEQVRGLGEHLGRSHFLFTPENFQIEDLKGVRSLKLSDDGELVMRLHGEKPNSDTEAIGCPFGIVIKGESGNKILWKWHEEIGKKVFPLVA